MYNKQFFKRLKIYLQIKLRIFLIFKTEGIILQIKRTKQYKSYAIDIYIDLSEKLYTKNQNYIFSNLVSNGLFDFNIIYWIHFIRSFFY